MTFAPASSRLHQKCGIRGTKMFVVFRRATVFVMSFSCSIFTNGLRHAQQRVRHSELGDSSVHILLYGSIFNIFPEWGFVMLRIPCLRHYRQANSSDSSVNGVLLKFITWSEAVWGLWQHVDAFGRHDPAPWPDVIVRWYEIPVIEWLSDRIRSGSLHIFSRRKSAK